jgi:hypothetical protein
MPPPMTYATDLRAHDKRLKLNAYSCLPIIRLLRESSELTGTSAETSKTYFSKRACAHLQTGLRLR